MYQNDPANAPVILDVDLVDVIRIFGGKAINKRAIGNRYCAVFVNNFD